MSRLHGYLLAGWASLSLTPPLLWAQNLPDADAPNPTTESVLADVAGTAPAASESLSPPLSPWQAAEQIQQLSLNVFTLLQQQREQLVRDPAPVYAAVDEQVRPYFDFERMAKLVLGADWDAAAPEQQARFLQAYQELVVRTYTISLKEYVQGSSRLVPLHQLADDQRRLTVKTRLQRSGSSFLIPVNYELYLRDGQWKVFNVVVDGISLVLSCRNSFLDGVNKSGFEHLVEQLEQRTVSENKPR